MSINDLHGLLGLQPSSEEISDQIRRLSSLVDSPNAAIPVIKSYPDAVYHNYVTLGISLLFVRTPTDLILDSIDVYNVEAGTNGRMTSERGFSTYPVVPLTLTHGEEKIEIYGGTTGKEFVKSIGEPERKGGGSGPSSGSIGIWCEWKKVGLMVELDARGVQAWDKGKDAVWRVITLFPCDYYIKTSY